MAYKLPPVFLYHCDTMPIANIMQIKASFAACYQIKYIWHSHYSAYFYYYYYVWWHRATSQRTHTKLNRHDTMKVCWKHFNIGIMCMNKERTWFWLSASISFTIIANVVGNLAWQMTFSNKSLCDYMCLAWHSLMVAMPNCDTCHVPYTITVYIHQWRREKFSNNYI